MKAIYNSREVDKLTLDSPFNNRAFRYGDGVFETIIQRNGEIFFLEYHLERLKNGCKCLQIKFPGELREKSKDLICNLLKKNKLEGDAVIKIQVWRAPGGKYKPQKNTGEFLITTDKYEVSSQSLKKAGFSKSVRIFPYPFSRFKTLNSLPFILASIEAKKESLDELILLNHKGFLTECLSSNLFWYKNECFYTPALNSGCIEGIMRRHILQTFRENSIKFKEVLSGKEALADAENVFSSNVTGIKIVKFIGEVEYSSGLNLPDKLQKFII